MTQIEGSDKAGVFGTPHVRLEGPDKVSGRALYESDAALPRLAHAALVTAPVKGRIEAIDTAAALAAPGILAVLTHESVGDAIRPVKHIMAGGFANSTWRPLAGPEVAYPGQIVALVVAESPETASAGAALVRVSLVATPAAKIMGEEPDVPLATLKPSHTDGRVGDVEAGMAEGAARVEADYRTPIQHHNPMELFATTCAWDGDHLTVHEPSRFVVGVQHGLAAQLGIAPDKVRVLSRLVGGHFGSRLGLSQHTALVALAARRLDRPVKLVPTRRDGFTIANYRPETRHAIRLAARADGRLTAFSHTARVATSRFDLFAMVGTDVTAGLYACPNVATEERVARVDRNTPGPMRAPPEVPYVFALESAMDELAHKLGIDPIELRRRNDTMTDPVDGKRYTTRPLMRCFDAAAARFGWERSRPAPRTRQDGDWLVGTGCAAAIRPVKAGPSALTLTFDANGHAHVETAHHEIGNGLITLLAMAAAEGLGVDVDDVAVSLGDSALPPGGLSGGSSTTTSLINAMRQACATMRARVSDAAVKGNGPLAGAAPETLRFLRGRLISPSGAEEPLTAALERMGCAPVSLRIGYYPDGSSPEGLAALEQGHMQLTQISGQRLACAFGAHFAEVHVHALTGEIRVKRLVGAFAAGAILNPLTAHSQVMGGMIWGLSAALLEATDVDPASGRYVNADLADYLVPTAADTPDVTAFFVEDEDREVNPAGVKGLGEIGIIGVNAAIANAIFSATGRRIRTLPIRLDAMI